MHNVHNYDTDKPSFFWGGGGVGDIWFLQLGLKIVLYIYTHFVVYI